MTSTPNVIVHLSGDADELGAAAGQAVAAAQAAALLARFPGYLHEPGADVAGIGRLVRQAWLGGLTVDEARRYWFDTAYHAEAFHAGYIVAGLLLRAAGANLKGHA